MPKKQAEQPTLPASSTNGFTPDMSDEDLLTALTAETVQPSFGYVRLKFTHGDKAIYRRLKVQPIDILRIPPLIDEMPEDTKQHILIETASVKSVGFSDEAWLQSLAACVLGLAPPMVVFDPRANEPVWEAGGDLQRLPDAMVALCRLGFDYWHIQAIADEVTQLTRDARDAAPNS